MMAPEPCARIAFKARDEQARVEIRWASSTRRASASVSSQERMRVATPALFTRPSMRPNSARQRSISPSAWAQTERSAGRGWRGRRRR